MHRRWTEPIVIRDQDIERFWNLVEIKDKDECWPPRGAPQAKKRGVYAQFALCQREGKNYRVTFARMALMITLGRELHYGMEACHRCHWAPCANPLHLFEGTPAENARSNPPEVSARGGHACRGVKKRPEHGVKQRIAQFTSRMRKCECGMETNAGSMGRHQKVTGHVMA